MGIKALKERNNRRGMLKIAKIKDTGIMMLMPKIKTRQPDRTLEETPQVSITFNKFKKLIRLIQLILAFTNFESSLTFPVTFVLFFTTYLSRE